MRIDGNAKVWFGHLVAGTALVMAGTVLAANLPTGLVGLTCFVVLLRCCWIEENIHADLLPSTTVPPGYRVTQRYRNRFLARWLRIWRDEITCPHLLASHLRVQSLALGAFFYGLLTTVVALHGGASLTLLILAACLLLVIGLRRAEQFALARMRVTQGVPLPRSHIVGRHPIAGWLINRLPDRPDRP